MEVLLLQDIPEIGKKDDLLIVGDGYALNFLLPQSKALIATPTVRRRYGERIRRRAEEKLAENASQEAKAATIADKEVAFARKVTKTGKLYAAISEKNIAEALKEQHKTDVEESDIVIDEPIKATGEFTVNVSLSGNDTPVKVTVTEEK